MEKALSRPLSDSVRKAFLKVERHRFFDGFYRWRSPTQFSWVTISHDAPDPEVLKEIYSVGPEGLPVKLSPEGYPTSCATSPPLVAYMLEILRLEPGMKVLEIGTGTGYNAALLAEIVEKQELVITLEIQPDLVERARRLLRKAGYRDVKVFCTDGFYGWPEESPYDRIVATTCCADISPYWLEQLSKNGWMLVPLYHGGEAPLVKIDSSRKGKLLSGAGFAHAQGMLSGPAIWTAEGKPLPNNIPTRKLTQLPSSVEFSRFVLYFHFFVALNESTACSSYGSPHQVTLLWDKRAEQGAGLIWQEDGWVLVGGNKHLMHRLEELFEEYEKLGRPRFEAYQMEFEVRSESEAERAQRVERVGPHQWIIKRRFTTQTVWL